MIKNYLKVTIRNLVKNRVFSLINLVGLSIGVGSAMMIFLYVNFEFSFDSFHIDAENIYRVTSQTENDGSISGGVKTFGSVGKDLRDQYPQVVDYAHFINMSGIMGNFVLAYDEKVYSLDKAIFAEEGFFKVFSFPLLGGDRENLLNQPFSVVLSESTAKKYFGEENPIGKLMLQNGTNTYKVTGVFADMPANSHFNFDILFSYSSWESHRVYQFMDRWSDHYQYVKLQPGVERTDFQEMVNQYTAATFPDEEGFSHILQPLNSIHLQSNMPGELSTNGDAKTNYFLLAVGALILIIAWANYTSLSIAQSTKREKEVGVRKSIGASKRQVAAQFGLEAVVVNTISTVVGFTIVQATFSGFENLVGRSLIMPAFPSPFWLMLLGILAIGALLSGLYPAFIQSAFKPTRALKGSSAASFKKFDLRKGLVIFQFAVSVVLIALTLTVYLQVNHMRQTNLGIALDNKLVVMGPAVRDSLFASRLVSFKNQLASKSSIERITLSSSVPGKEITWGTSIRLLDQEEGINVQMLGIDETFADIYQLQLLAGQAYVEGRDYSNSVILNESALARLGINSPEEAIGKLIHMGFWGRDREVIGVYANYHHLSVKRAQPALALLYRASSNHISIAFNTTRYQQLLSDIEEVYAEMFPGNAFDYFFLDESFDRQYKSDKQFGVIFTIFSALALFIACIGLFGLVLYSTIQRMKEIGIRKVMGASDGSIIGLLNLEFMKLVGIAIVLGLPLAYYLIDGWLQSYPLRIDLSWLLLVVPAIAVLVICLLTISLQSLKAARANPIKSIRYE